MRSKRKASQVFTTASPTKRREQWNQNYVVTSSDEEDASTDEIEDGSSDEEWEINGILDENQSEYLIDWVGPYSPTWEPKENASESAVQVWEEKRKAQLVSECSSVQPPSLQSQSQLQLHNSVSHQRAETPEQEFALQQHLDSPLFVSLDTVPETQSQNTNGPPPSNLTTGSASRSTNTRAPTTRNCDNVFEYYPRAPIPSEYCLPGEVEEQRESTTGTVPTPETRSSTLTKEISDHPGILRQTTTAQATLRSEIPETPSIAFAPSQSQIPRAGPRFPTFGSQQSVGLTQLPLSNPSLDYLPNPHTSAGRPNPAFSTNLDSRRVYSPSIHTASVPESALANTLQPLYALSSTTYTEHTSGDTVGHSQLALARQPPATQRLLPSGNLPCLSQRPVGDTGSLPIARTPNRGFAPIHFARTSDTMDDQIQRDEGGSLAQAMEKYSHVEGSTPREKIMNLHARFREKSTFESMQNDPSATPSSVGDIEASEPPSIPETVAPLSVRVDKEPSHADIIKELVPETSLDEAEPQEHEHDNIQTIHPSALSISHTEEKPPGSLHLGVSEFAVPLPMDSRVKDDYEQILLTDSENALGLIGADRPQGAEASEERVISLIQQALERLSNAATHPDINVAQHMKDVESKLEQEAAWAEYSSAKFLLLNYLIKAAGDHDIHLVIMVRGEKTQRVVERYLNGKGFEYTRPREMGSGTNVEISMVKGSLSFGVQAVRSEGIVETYKAPSALIALDSSLNIKNPSVEHMRTTFARNGHLLPVIRLMVANSSEHVELCFPGPSTTEHLSMLIQYSLELRDIVGELQDDALGVQEDANEIMTCLLSDNFNAFWSLPPVEPLREAHLEEPAQSETPIQSDGENAKTAKPQAQKRLFAEESIEPNSKRPRMDESQDTSQFTDSSKGASQSLESQIQFLEKSMVQKKSEDTAALETLQKALAAAESRLQEREKILGSLQHRYESRTSDLHKIRQERDRLLETKSASEQRLEKQKEDITKLKDERSQLKLDLEQAREALKNGGGDMAELEKAREEIRRLTKENASLERKADFADKQAEYTREQYQTASNVAAQSGNELRQLKEENEALTRKVAGEASRLREINLKNDESHHLSRIAELEALLSSREYLLHKKEDELREIRKNRPSTRSTSTQPRSPKLTAGNHSRPTSPGLNNNGSNFPGRGSALRFSSEMSL